MNLLLGLDPQRRDAVLNAALKEFASKGYDKASTNEIAKTAGLSKALMFHYAKTKRELFLCVYDYFSEILDKRYDAQLDLDEKDIFKRIRQSVLLQIELLKQYPWILEFNKLSSTTSCETVNKELEKRAGKKHSSCCRLFDGMDESGFRKGLDIEKCKQMLLWINAGLTNQLLDGIRSAGANETNYGNIVIKIDGYFDELRKIFY